MIPFILGVFLGAVVGVCLMGILMAGKIADIETDAVLRGSPDDVDEWWKDGPPPRPIR